MRLFFSVATSLCLVGVMANAQVVAPATIPVSTVKAERKQISKSPDFVGRIEAVNRVEVRARVKGYLEAVLFREGDIVKEGDALYRIEKGLFEASVQQAEGALERSKAALTLAQLNFDRAEELLKRNAGTVVARDQAQAGRRCGRVPFLLMKAISTAEITRIAVLRRLQERSAAAVIKAAWLVREGRP
jgi:membrane fusion protein (multidrug efflux system)